MNEDKKHEKHQMECEANPFKIACPICGLNSIIILDPKQISDKNSFRLCLVCGHVFEYIAPSK